MKNILRFISILLLIGSSLQAATVTQIFTQAIGRHWMEVDDGGGNNYWSDGAAPTNTNDYISPAGMVLRSPEGNGAPDFPGNSLRIDAGATLSMKMNYGQDSFILGELIMNGGTLGCWNGTTGNGYQFLDLNTNLFRVATNSFVAIAGTNRRRLQIRNALFTGPGSIQINGNQDLDEFVLGPSVTSSNFTGAWIINGGVLSVVNGSLLANTNQGVVVNVNPGQVGIPSPSLDLNGTQVGTHVPLELNSDGGAGLRTRIRTLSGTNEWAGPISLKGDGSIQLNAEAAASVLILSGPLSGTNTSTLMFRGNGAGILSNNLIAPNANFTKTDNGRWTIDSLTNRIAALRISVGTLEVTRDNSISTNATVAMGQAGSAAVFNLNGTRQTISDLSVNPGAPNNQVIGSSSTNRDTRLTINSAGSNTFAGIIQDSLGGGTRKVGLTIDGGYHLNLAGINPYTGSTILSNGTLLVSGSVGGVVTAFNASVYGGGGICDALTTESGARHQPGFNGVGTDTINGRYDLRGTLDIEIDGAADRIDVAGLLNFGTNAGLNIMEISPADKPIKIIAEYSARNGTFASTNGLPTGYRLFYDFGPSSNQIALVHTASYLWDGEAPGNSWAAGTNWITDVSPPAITTNTIYFDILGATTVGPDTQTSHLDRDRSIGSLQLASELGFYHNIDLTGFALNVTGDIRMTEPGRDTVMTITNSLTNGQLSLTNGSIQIGLNGVTNTLRIQSGFTMFSTSGIIDIARRIGNTPSNTTATLDFSASSNLNITAEEILMAHASADNGGLVRGILHLAANGSNIISVSNITVGVSPLAGNSGPPASEIHFGGAVNELYADTVTLGYQKSDAIVDVRPGGSLLLRGRSKPEMTMRLGFNSSITATLGDGIFNASGTLLDARFDTLELGQHTSGNGGGRGTFTMDAGSAFASNIILAVTGGANPGNTLGIINVNGGAFQVADSVIDGNGAGTINVNDGYMAVTNHLMVDTLLVGGTGNNNAVMQVRRQATIGTGSQTLQVARNTAVGTTSRGLLDLRTASNVVIRVAAFQIGTGSYMSYGTVMLGTNGLNDITATTLTMGDVNPNGNQAEWNHLVAGGITVIDANDIYIGQRKSRSQISMHTNATLFLGGLGNRINNLNIGFNNINTGTTGFGLLNGSNGALNVYANTVVLGRHDGTSNLGGSGTGTLVMESSNDLFDAVSVTLGHTDGDADSTASGILLHSNGTFRTDVLVLGNAKDFGTASGTVVFDAGIFVAHSIRQGLTSGVSTVAFDWFGGSLTSSNIVLGIPLIQNGGLLVPGGITNVGSTAITGSYAVVNGAWDIDLDSTGAGTGDFVNVSGSLSLSNAVLNLNPDALDDPEYIIAEYGARSGTFSAVNNLPPGYSVVYDYGGGGNQIAVVLSAIRTGTMIIIK